jgi:hypothetical protein
MQEAGNRRGRTARRDEDIWNIPDDATNENIDQLICEENPIVE